MKIGIVAGEQSGDILGSRLLQAIAHQHPQSEFYGIGGDAMQKQGLQSVYGIESLSVNGFIEPLLKLRSLIQIYRSTVQHLMAKDIDVFIGVDFNFFNLLLEKAFKKRGIPTVHLVSPTVWAWRKGRLKRIKKSTDLMLTLWPFETEIYHQHDIAAKFVGHPLADELPITVDTNAARVALSIDPTDTVLVLMPGSRRSEIEHIGPLFLEAAQLCLQHFPELTIILPSANEQCLEPLQDLIEQYQMAAQVRLVRSDSRQAMTAADIVLAKSGTSTFEAMLLKKPMVMAYRLGKITYAIASRLVTTNRFALPNILANEDLVPEFIQDQATPEKLADAVLSKLNENNEPLKQRFCELHEQLKQNYAQRAADAISELVAKQ